MNQDIINEITNQDYEEISKKIEEFLTTQIENKKSNGVIIGLSGGIDSAVLAYLCKRKLKEKTLALSMPDTAITPNGETPWEEKFTFPFTRASFRPLILKASQMVFTF